MLIELDEDGVFIAEVPSLPGCVTQGASREAALRNAHEAIGLYLESLVDRWRWMRESLSESER